MSASGEELIWVLFVGIGFSLILAFGIGANNAANTCGVVYGTKSMSFRMISLILLITRAIGTIIMSFQLTQLKPELATRYSCTQMNGTKSDLMIKYAVTITGSSIWLMLCTLLGLPVSAIHSIIGAELGYYLTKKGILNVNWSYYIKAYILQGTAGLVTITMFSSILAYNLFYIMVTRLKTFAKTNHGFRWWTSHSLEFCVLSTMFIFITYTPSALINFDKMAMYNILHPAVRICLGLLMFYVWERNRKHVLKCGASFSSHIVRTLKKFFSIRHLNICSCAIKSNCDDFKTHDSDIHVEESGKLLESPVPEKTCNCCVCIVNLSSNKYAMDHCTYRQTSTTDQPQQTVIDEDMVINENPVFDPNSCEDHSDVLRARWFTRLTQIVVIFSCVAYGAHDVSNSVSSVFVMMKLTSQGRLLDICDEKISILVLLMGFIVISLGVLCCGKFVMRTVADLVKLEPISGFCVEMSTVFSIFILSHLFIIPVSVTYCKVVAMAAVGLVDKTLNWTCFCKILLFWFLTIPATALIGGLACAVMF